MLAARVAGVAEPEETALLGRGQRDVAITEQRPDRQGVRLLARCDGSAAPMLTRRELSGDLQDQELLYAPVQIGRPLLGN